MRLPPGTPAIVPWAGLGVACTVRACCLSGLTPSVCPAVRRRGETALIKAALHFTDRDAIVRKLVEARADVNTKSNAGCAFSARSALVGGAPTVPAPAPSGRRTALHHAAFRGNTEAAVALLVGGADQSITDCLGYRCAAHIRATAAHRIGAGTRPANLRKLALATSS
jgi:hypothetical protein